MTDAAFGAFGKMPSLGDFFRISAPPGFLDVWDDWLQSCLVSGAHTFGSRWDALYMSVPIWRFSLSAGLAGPKKMMGVLMPSVDRVGRRFPLTLMHPVDGTSPAAQDHFLHLDLFEKLEDIALSTLEDDASKDGLTEALAGLTFPKDAVETVMLRSPRCLRFRHDRGLTETPSLLAAELLGQSYADPSIWSAVIDGDTRLMVCEGLPHGPDMQGLFDLDSDVWKADHS